MPNPTRTLLWIAGAAWLASWFLPVIDGYVGWQAFRAVFDSPMSAPRGWEDQAAQILSGLTNFVFLGFFSSLLSRNIRPGLLIRAGLACFVVNLYWFVQAARGGTWDALLVGYYLWLASYALLVVIGVSSHRTSRTPTAGTPA
jgi:hypothetical protein